MSSSSQSSSANTSLSSASLSSSASAAAAAAASGTVMRSVDTDLHTPSPLISASSLSSGSSQQRLNSSAAWSAGSQSSSADDGSAAKVTVSRDQKMVHSLFLTLGLDLEKILRSTQVYLKFIAGSIYDSDLQRANISLRNIAS